MDLGGENGICDVGCLGGLEAGVEGVAGGEGGDDPGLAGMALPTDLFQELGGVGIDLGGGGEDTQDGRGRLLSDSLDGSLQAAGFYAHGPSGGPRSADSHRSGRR